MPEGRIITTERVYWTAFIGLFFDYYDLYLFVYLEKVLAQHFGLSVGASNVLQFVGIAGVGLGALLFGYLADRFGRGRMMLIVFVVYVIGIAGISLSPTFSSVVTWRLVASLALGAEWGISHTFVSDHVSREKRYRFAALLQFSILGGLLAAMASKYILPHVGWRPLFAASIIPVVILSLVRWRWLVRGGDCSRLRAESVEFREKLKSQSEGKGISQRGLEARPPALVGPFLRCLGIASLTIASGTVNVFFAKELPQSTWYTALFWGNVAPGMLLGAWIVRKLDVRRALIGYAVGLVMLSAFAWTSPWEERKLAFALMLPLLNGIPFGLMGAYFNDVFVRYRTMLSGTAYNVGRILAGFAPVLITALGLHVGGNYFLFTAALGIGVLAIGWGMREASSDS